MRTTVDLPEPIYEYVRDLAHDRKTSISQAIVRVIERGMTALPDAELRVSPVTGFTVMHFGEGPITHEDVRSLEDDE